MQHVLRAISGPHAGAVYVLGSRTTIGRASDCEIQILHEGVSRHHAKLTLEDDGTLVVADLSSDNGTFVEDERVERHVLAAGQVVRVMRSRFAYEVLLTEEVVTSVAFHRKVTSGDSLRQTVLHDRPLASARAGLVQGLPGGMIGERGRLYSRPQAAAPALSGARPGAAAARPGGAEPPIADSPADAAGDTPRVRRPTPPLGADPGASARRPRVAAAAAAAAAHETPPVPSRMVTLGQGRRDRATLTPGAGAPSSGEPAGRMAPVAPSGVEPERQGSPHGTAPIGSGWIRVTRPLEAPGSMRPGATLTGVPRVGDEASVPTASPSPRNADAGDSPARGTKHETAEYGAVGERQTTERGLAAPPIAPGLAAPATPARALEPEAELDAMKTVPALRRGSVRSSTPTEEVPRIRNLDPLDEDSHVKTQPRVTLVPRDRGPAAPPVAMVKPPPTVTPEPSIVASPPDPASSPDDAPTIDTALARRLTTTPGSVRPRARSIAYEDTLRFQRPEPRPADEPNVPQARPHATTAEVISALESLLPPDDASEPRPSEPLRPDARTHASGLGPSSTVDVLLQAVLSDVAWSPEVADPSQLDEAELRAQQVLEDVDREHKQREGLDRLVEILEYRELRLRALQSSAGDAGAVERCAVLEQALQQRPPAGDDMAAMRRYHRFVCSIPAQLTHLPRGTKSTATVEIEDLSAGGARITFGEYSIGAGETVWLAIELAPADRSRIPDPTASTVVMKARVVWSRPHEAKLGLVFAGAPQYGP